MLRFSGNGTLQPSSAQGVIHVYDSANVAIALELDHLAPIANTVLIEVLDSGQSPVSAATIHTVAILEGITILDSWDITTTDGTVSLPVTLTRPGTLEVTVTMAEQLWVREASNQTQWTVLGVTSISLDLPALSIDQGTRLGCTMVQRHSG